ncbi:MAG: arylsulfatase [Betaproteobacteria bacterium]|nr:arylsulfatase [Betaproteobacteria bacterium]
MAQRRKPQPPNIVLILADNLGWGELGCYGGGVLRGAPTPRIDRLAAEGLRLTNFNVESDCVPTRSALMTGRHPIRTGALQSVPAGLPQGIIPWEITIAQLLSARGYATAIHGKWHLGDRAGRFPTDRGFDEWYGIPRTTNESMFTASPGYDPRIVPLPRVMEGRRGRPARNVAVYDLDMRRRIDSDLVARARSFMRRQVKAAKPFFAYVPLTQLHYPTLPHRDFAGKTGAGDFADSLAEMDHRVGQILDEMDSLKITSDSLVIFASDNGPEFRRPWRGTAGPWTGTYHTAMEGGLRAPLLIRWPGRVPAGGVSNEIVHVTDLYPTLARAAGTGVPPDRPVDGVDQLDFFRGKQSRSRREGFVFYIKNEPRAVKWRNWKMHLVWEAEPNAGANHLESPVIFNLLQDPKEETDVHAVSSWVRTPMRRMIHAFQESLKAHPPIPPGAPDDYVPGSARTRKARKP